MKEFLSINNFDELHVLDTVTVCNTMGHSYIAWDKQDICFRVTEIVVALLLA